MRHAASEKNGMCIRKKKKKKEINQLIVRSYVELEGYALDRVNILSPFSLIPLLVGSPSFGVL